MIRYLTIALAMAVCFAASISGAAPTALPFVEDFESYSLGSLPLSRPWSVADTSGAATVQSTNVLAGEDINNDAADGTKSGMADLCDLTLSIDAAENATNCWFMVYSKPTPYNDAVLPTVPTNDHAAFYLNSSGQVKAMDGSSWTIVGVGVPTDEWLAFVVHLDYANDLWDLYLSQDNTYGTLLAKLNSSPLGQGVASTNARLSEFTVQGVAALDAIAIQNEWRGVSASSKSNVVVTAIELASSQQINIGLFAHDYNASQDNLAAELGDDLQTWLQVGDDVSLYDGGTETFTYDGLPLDGWDDSGATIVPADAHVSPGHGVWIAKGGANSEPFLAFMDYDELSSTPVDVKGTDNDNGMNFLAWDKPATSLPLGDPAGAAGFGPTAGTGDKMYIQVPGTKAASSLKRLYWDDTGNRWMDGANPADAHTLAPGQTFWYYRGSQGLDGTWNLKDAN